MSDKNYTYAVARIRAMEMTLFSSSVIEQLMAVKSYEGCLAFLAEKGWGTGNPSQTGEEILEAEREKAQKTVKELLRGEDQILSVLTYQNLYHNLKAAIKESVSSDFRGSVYYDDCAVDGKEMERIVAEKDFDALPEHMRKAAREACETFLHTGDGQACDVIVDRAALEAICSEGKKSREPVILAYAESVTAVADIKIAVRSQKTGKELEFMRRAMAPCDSLDVERLAMAALSGVSAICEYLGETAYKDGAEALKESASAFERWCDNQLIESIKPQKYNPFSAGPLVAYLLARENEIKTVRIILTGKLNGLPDERIRERIREMYV